MSPSDPSEPERGDRTSLFVRLLGEHERPLRAYVLSLVPNWVEADEIVQQTRIRIWEQFDQYDASKDFGPWSRAIAYYLVLAERERAARYPQLRDPVFLEAVTREFESAAPRASALTRALAECLKKLDAARHALVMRYYSGRETMDQIARDLETSPGSVKVRIHRARLALAACVDATVKERE